MRSLILQLDPEWYEEHEQEDERKYSYDCMITWVCETFGKENIISFSVHEDETNPHIHVSFCPVTQDGRLSQKDFIDKKMLKNQHKSLREYMTEKGFDIEMRNKKPGKYAKRMSVDEYKDYAELQSEHEILDSAFRFNVKRREELKKRESDLDNRESNLESKEQAFREKVWRFKEQAKNWQDELQALAEEYWNRSEADDALVRFAKIAVNKKGISFYDKFKQYQKAEKARMQEKLNRMDEIVRQYEQSRYSEQSEMGY